MSNLQQKVRCPVTSSKMWHFVFCHCISFLYCIFCTVTQIDDKKKAIKDANNELKDLKHEAKQSDSVTLTRYANKNELCAIIREKCSILEQYSYILCQI